MTVIECSQATTIVETRQIVYKLQNVLSRLDTLFYTQFSEESLKQVQCDIQACLEEYAYYLDQARNSPKLTEGDKALFENIFNNILRESKSKELDHIYQRQKVIEQINSLKQTWCQIVSDDTCINYAENLENEAEGLKQSLEADEDLKSFCQDLLEELEDIIIRIKAARKDINVATLLEVVSGVTTLAASCASVVVGTTAAVVSKVVSKTAIGAAVTVDAGEIGLAVAGNSAPPIVKTMEVLIKVVGWFKKILSGLKWVFYVFVNGVVAIKEHGLKALIQIKLVEIKSLFHSIGEKVATFFRKRIWGAKMHKE